MRKWQIINDYQNKNNMATPNNNNRQEQEQLPKVSGMTGTPMVSGGGRFTYTQAIDLYKQAGAEGKISMLAGTEGYMPISTFHGLINSTFSNIPQDFEVLDYDQGEEYTGEIPEWMSRLTSDQLNSVMRFDREELGINDENIRSFVKKFNESGLSHAPLKLTRGGTPGTESS